MTEKEYVIYNAY